MVRGDVLMLHAMGAPFTMLPPEEEVCCGFPLFITGQHDLLPDLVKRLVSAYEKRGVETLACSCPCCVNIMARDWPLLYGKKLPFRIRHTTQIAVEGLRKGTLASRAEGPYLSTLLLKQGVGSSRAARGPAVTLGRRSLSSTRTASTPAAAERAAQRGRCS
jgi:Fe-S oxidoreductase